MTPDLGIVLPCAGSGTRVGAERPKQFLDLGGRPVFHHSLESFLDHPRTSCVILVVAASERDALRDSLASTPSFAAAMHADRLRLAVGGAERWESVRNGVTALPPDCEVVVVHDVARPFVTDSDIDAVADAALRDGASLLALPCPDTVKVAAGHDPSGPLVASTQDRRLVWLAQTPQAFRREILDDCYVRLAIRQDLSPTDEAGLAEAFGHPVRLVPGASRLHKITTAEDLDWARSALSRTP